MPSVRPPRLIAALLLPAVLAGCEAREPAGAPPRVDQATPAAADPAPAAARVPAPAQSTAPTPALAVDGEGLRLFDRSSGSARPLAFGSPREQVMSALAFRGPPEIGRQEECGPGPLDYAAWPDGLKLYFQDGKLAGWALDGRAADGIGTSAGIGPGSTRAELDSAYVTTVEETTLGTEFLAGEIGGILDGRRADARISAMWAGASCNFR